MTAHTENELRFVPLGGVGEFGANLALYGIGGKWLMLDCGLAFANDAVPGVDILVPDPAFIAERRRDLVALVLTHAHEDHLGAVPYLWPMLECPVIATPFTAALLRRKLEEAGLAARVPVRIAALGSTVSLPPFEVSYVAVTHSILEAHSVAIRTPAGTIVHSGDWKLDEDPRIGPRTDEPALTALGDKGVVALMGDSTNATTPGHSGSEGALRASIAEVVGEATGRVAVTQFASNAQRIETVARAAEAHDRELVVVGRSLWRTIEAARECGYLHDLPPLLEAEDARNLPPRNTLLLLTGCQGEPRGAMARVAAGDHRHIRLAAGDTAIFSSKVIPGNERPIADVVNRLVRAGVRVVTERDRFVHVSGHPARDELVRMLAMLRPGIVVPVHGELRHLMSHAELAEANGVAQTLVVENGAVVRLAPGPAEVVDEVHVGKLAVTSAGLTALDSPAVQARKRMMFNGNATAFLVFGEDGRLAAPPRLVLRGIEVGTDGGIERAAREVADRVGDLPRARRGSDAEVELAVRQTLRSLLRAGTSQRPSIDVEIVRLPAEESIAVRQGTLEERR